MSYTGYLTNKLDLNNYQVKDFILSSNDFGRLSQLSMSAVKTLLEEARSIRPEAKVFFEWDSLQTQKEFEKKVELIKKFDLTLFDAIRVAEIGAFHWALENTNLPIHLILENGHHNLKGIQAWEKVAGNRLERIVLSLELPKETLSKYCQNLKTPTELQVLGELVLFYSPRSLVKNQLTFEKPNLEVPWYQAKANSEESPHRGFTILENIHGSFMLNPKKQSLLQVLGEVKECGVEFFKVDHRLFGVGLDQLTFTQENLSELLPDEKFIRGYFNVNKTDKIFVKLKNHRLQRRDEAFVGTVVDVKKDQYIAIKIENNQSGLKVNSKIEFTTPEGKKKFMPVKSLKNISLKEIDTLKDEHLVLVPHTSGISVKTRVNLSVPTA